MAGAGWSGKIWGLFPVSIFLADYQSAETRGEKQRPCAEEEEE